MIMQTIREELDQVKQPIGDLFTVKPASQWIEEAAQRPAPKMLLSELFYEGEICILFSDTNLGKSVLAAQAGIAIANGTDFDGLINESSQKKVLLVDFELTDKQFQIRYTDKQSGTLYPLPENFHRAEINRETLQDLGNLELHLEMELGAMIERHGFEFLIIDNLTWLTGEDVTDAKTALPLMKMLCDLKRGYGITMLVLAHTPKRDETKPIHVNDCGGSKMLGNFCDSMFAIGRSTQEPQMRYIKQLKQRNCAQKFGTENVLVYSLEKDGAFLGFKFIGTGIETDHLKKLEDGVKQDRIDKVHELKAKDMNNMKRSFII